ncbi:MAG: FCD domain-containing protein, partial [Acetobacteraceae bacterium]
PDRGCETLRRSRHDPRPGVSNCRDEDHDEIFEAFRTRDPDAAALLMSEHLRHIQENLELSGPAEGASDLVAIFRK